MSTSANTYITKVKNVYNVQDQEYKISFSLQNIPKTYIEQYRFCRIGFRKSSGGKFFEIMLPLRKQLEDEPINKDWQPENVKLYDENDDGIIDFKKFKNDNNYRVSIFNQAINKEKGFSSIIFRELDPGFSYYFNIAFTNCVLNSENKLEYYPNIAFCENPVVIYCTHKKDRILSSQFEEKTAGDDYSSTKPSQNNKNESELEILQIPTTLSTPKLDEVQPAFYSNAKDKIFYFRMDTDLIDYKICYKLISLYSGKSALIDESEFQVTNNVNRDKAFQIPVNQLSSGKWLPGIYKISIKILLDKEERASEWSNFSLVKVLEHQPIVSVENNTENILMIDTVKTDNNPTFTGYFSGVASEPVSKYCFILYENEKVLKNSGFQDHLKENDVIRGDTIASKDSYNFGITLEPGIKYMLEYKIQTINNYQFTSKYYFSIEHYAKEKLSEITKFEAKSEEEDGAIYVSIEGDQAVGKYILLRKNISNKLSYLETLDYIRGNDIQSGYLYRDYMVESGTQYKYYLRKEEATKVIAGEAETSIAQVFFNACFLYGQGHQLKLSLNNTLNSFKYNIQQQKQESLGGKYPIILRNSNIYYAEFPINGLITLNIDDQHSFFTETPIKENDKIIGYKYSYDNLEFQSEQSIAFGTATNLTGDNIYNERIFRQGVERFLNDGNLKIFKSPTEGNFLISLVNVSFSPEVQLGRMIYNFSSTAYEMGEINQSALYEHNIITKPIEEIDEYYYNNIYHLFYSELKEYTDSYVYDLNSLYKQLNQVSFNKFLDYGYRIKKIKYIAVNNNSSVYADLIFTDGFTFKVMPQSTFYIPEENLNKFQSFTCAHGGITIIVELQQFSRKKVRNISNFGITAQTNLEKVDEKCQLIYNVSPYDGSKQENKDKSVIFNADLPYIDFSSIFHEQIQKIYNNDFIYWIPNENFTGKDSNLDKYIIKQINYLHLINNNPDRSPVYLYLNGSQTPTVLQDQLFLNFDEDAGIESLYIPVCKNLDIMTITTISYYFMEGAAIFNE